MQIERSYADYRVFMGLCSAGFYIYNNHKKGLSHIANKSLYIPLGFYYYGMKFGPFAGLAFKFVAERRRQHRKEQDTYRNKQKPLQKRQDQAKEP
jgi:hypothetical protein